MKLKLSSPWMTYYRKVKELLDYDPEVKVAFDEDEGEIVVRVDGNSGKADALTILLPDSATFGNVTVAVRVIPANKPNGEKVSLDELFNRAFEGNPAFGFTKVVQGVYQKPFLYVVFKNKVVQFFNDDIGDIYGCESTLYEDIAREVFSHLQNAYFCTDTEGKVNLPSGEWP